jgi:hypothetical protein
MLCDLPVAIESPSDTDVRINEVLRFNERIERFWAQAAAPFDFVAMPNAGRLNWRYCDTRGGNGFVLQAEAEGEVVGFVVVRISRGLGHIAYLLTLPDRTDVIHALVAAALARMGAPGLSHASCVLPQHHPYRPDLIAAGFTGEGKHVPLTARPRIGDPALPFLRRQSPIHWMLGDTDLI